MTTQDDLESDRSDRHGSNWDTAPYGRFIMLQRGWDTQIFTMAAATAPDPPQTYYWTPEWQKDERGADRDIAAGRLYPMTQDDLESDRSDRHNSNPVGSGILLAVFILSLLALIALALTDGGI